jgi:ribonuclease HI
LKGINPEVMSIGESNGDKVWKRLWGLNVPAKIRKFGALHRLITCLGVLANRHIGNSSQCQICNADGTIKINVDAAYDIDRGKGGMGAIARASGGKFLIASCKKIHFVADSFMAEAYALREGLSLAQDLGSTNLIIQSDNSQVIETTNEGGFSSTASAAIFNNRMILDSGFRNIYFEHCNRKANEVAHALARCLGIVSLVMLIFFGC